MSSVKCTGVIVFLLIASWGVAQNVTQQPKMRWVKPLKGTVCYGIPLDANTFVPPPTQYLAAKRNTTARIKSATINVNYIGFSNDAKTAFQAAVDIWETLISSPVPINLTAEWHALGTNVLGSATPYTFYVNFDNAQRNDIWYPVALAEKIAGKELNDPSEPDIYASFNSAQTAWYYGTDGATPSGKYDLMSVVLHEICHGLGITHSYEVTGSSGDIQSFFGVPVVYETFLENQTGQNLVKNFASPSVNLKTQITSNALFFNSTLVKAKNANQRGRMYAPATYSAGSSIAHTDEAAYPQGDINSLMTPFFNSKEAIHNPGPITMGILKDMGWNTEYIQHTPLPNTENVSNDFPVTCQISGDTTYDASSMKLFYSTDGTNFVSQPMQATANADEFTATIPKPTVPVGQLTTYQYYFSVKDVIPRTFFKPGLIWSQGSSSTPQLLYVFQAGPDTKPPRITHVPFGFVKNTDHQLIISAEVTDNIGIQSAVVQYSINGVNMADVPMTNSIDSTYTATLNFSVNSGDTIRYRIKAVDSSVEQDPTLNVAYSPASKYYIVNVVSLAATQTSYRNNFNAPTTDFFGDSFFTIGASTGFASKAIHSAHPYPNANSLNKDSVSYVYELRVPIKLKQTGAATLQYDEVVLVEPGKAGSTWPSVDFYDYLTVEGSKDGGVTWKYLTKGYDSRDQAAWLTRWNSNVDTNGNSLAVGDSTLYKTRIIDMTATGFKAGDVIVIRFRLFSDPFAYGWGWAIDNLKIQIDETPPTILHNQVDFISVTTANFDLTTKVTDPSGTKDLSIDYGVNNSNFTNAPIIIVPGQDQYTLTLNTLGSNLQAGDEIEYRINATDSLGNATSLPATGYLKIAVLNLKTSVDTYVSDFNSANTDFAGNFFSIDTPAGFNNGAIQSTHPYPNGFGLDNTSSYTYMLKTPIKIGTINQKMLFDEMVIAETAFGGIKDYVVVEGSKDRGATWLPLVSSYSSNALGTWQSAYTAKQNGSPSLYKARLIDLTQSGNFQAGDSVLVRFRLHADASTNAWGWAIDNLSIQGTVTGIEKLPADYLTIYPNPVSSDYLNVVMPRLGNPAGLTITDMLGRQVTEVSLSAGTDEQKVFVGNLNDGIYIVRVSSDQGQITKKVVIKR